MTEREPDVIVDADGMARCWWCGTAPDYMAYHDREWGFPVAEDRALFEKVCLEGFQSGLSWLTILRKRDAFREVFCDFEPGAVARLGTRDVRRLLADARIVRHRGKIEATIHNAKRAHELADEFGSLATYFCSHQPRPAAHPRKFTRSRLSRLTTTPEAMALSVDLKRRGWKFVGPTTMYSFMQATGLVNDHVEQCHARAWVEAARAQL